MSSRPPPLQRRRLGKRCGGQRHTVQGFNGHRDVDVGGAMNPIEQISAVNAVKNNIHYDPTHSGV